MNIANARAQYLENVSQVETLRLDHIDAVQRLRKDVSDCDRRGAETEATIAQCERQHVEDLFYIDTKKKSLLSLERRVAAEVETKELLPTPEALESEISALENAQQQVRDAISREHLRLAKEQEIRALRLTMAKENEELEKETLVAMQAAREAKARTDDLTVRVSLQLATRNKLAQRSITAAKALESLASDEEDLVQLHQQQRSAMDALTSTMDLLESEQLVVRDLSREALMHDSITASVLSIAIEDERRMTTVEAELQRELEKLHKLKDALASRVSK